jgi:serine/threonine-protein kinase
MSSAPPEGTILRGKYRVERVLGQGGMGVVVAAMHLGLKQRVAIKLLNAELAESPEIVERFLREAHTASRIQGDHVVRVMDVDTLDSGAPFMVMEHLDGADLSSVRRSKRPLPIPTAVRYVLEACEAIAEAHELGIVHRDLKPANLFLATRRDGTTRVKVLDFGISKILEPGPEEVELTKTNMVAGSAQYMSPEQMLSTRDVDARTDIWSLGVVLFELSAGQLPFPAKTVTQACALIMSTPPPLLRSLVPDAPPELEAIVQRCLEKDRDRRFATVRELMVALRPFAAAQASDASQASLVSQAPHVAQGVGPPPASLVAEGTMSDGARTLLVESTTAGVASLPVATRAQSRARLRVLAAVALAVGGACALGAAALFGAHGPERSSEPSAPEPASPTPHASVEPAEPAATATAPAPAAAPPPVASASASTRAATPRPPVTHAAPRRRPVGPAKPAGDGID